MARYEIRPATVADYVDAVTNGQVDHWRVPEVEGRAHLAAGPAYAAYVDEELAAVAGVHVTTRGRGDCWAVLTKRGREHGRFVTRAVVRGLCAIIAQYALVRVEAVTVRENWVARYWLGRMGFKRESMMRKYADGVDFCKYVHFPGEDRKWRTAERPQR